MFLRAALFASILALFVSCGESDQNQLEGSWKLDVKLTRQSREFKELSDEKKEAMRGKFKTFPNRLVIEGERFRLGEDRYTFTVKKDEDGELVLDLVDSEGEAREMSLRVRKDRLYISDPDRPLAFTRHY